jgi:hypothetical protein
VTAEGHIRLRDSWYWSCHEVVRMLNADSVLVVGRSAALCKLRSDLSAYLRAVYSGPKVVLRSKHVRKDPRLFDSTHAQDVPLQVCHCVFGCLSVIFVDTDTGLILPPRSARHVKQVRARYVNQLRARIREVRNTDPCLPTNLITTS